MHLTTHIGNISYLTYTFLSHLPDTSNPGDNGEDRDDPHHGPLSYSSELLRMKEAHDDSTACKSQASQALEKALT